jgi:DNA gyrase subunit A
VRGIALAKEDEVISMAILRHVDATPEERMTFLKRATAMRRALGIEVGEEAAATAAEGIETDEPVTREVELGDKYANMDEAQQFVLTLSERGFGKRTSSYEYRITNRGGKGIVAMAVNDRNGPLVASFPVGDHDQIMLITEGGQTIRVPVEGIRIAGRSTQGVTVFKTDGDRVVSVEHIAGEAGAEELDGENGDSPDTPQPGGEPTGREGA